MPAMKKKNDLFDLNEIFERVNETYFDGKIAKPRLTWSARVSKSTMGKYNYATDTLTLNRLLNRAGTPRYVLEFLMYHELLHKALGYQIVNQRRRVHTPRFRKLEKTFHQYREANDYLRVLAKNEHEKSLDSRRRTVSVRGAEPREKSYFERFLELFAL